MYGCNHSPLQRSQHGLILLLSRMVPTNVTIPYCCWLGVIIKLYLPLWKNQVSLVDCNTPFASIAPSVNSSLPTWKYVWFAWKILAYQSHLLCNSMFGVGCEIYTRELPSVYFITNIKHCITYLALTQLVPTLISHPEMYTLYSICCITFRSFYFLVMDAFTWDKWIL